MNVGRSLGDDDALLAFVLDCDLHYPDWGVIFLSELDGFYHHSRELDVGLHYAFRYWPGHGSVPMALIINRRLSGLQRSVVPLGRSIRVHLTDLLTLNCCIVACHGGHGDALPSSLADVSALCTSRPRGSAVVILGDLNVDQLPVLSSDPWADSPSRHLHHHFERVLLDKVCDNFHLQVYLPELVNGVPGGPHASAALSAPFSRIPTGDQVAFPSLLDYAVCESGALKNSMLDWDLQQSDHAAFISTFDKLYVPPHPRPKSTWRPHDWDSCRAWVLSHRPETINTITDFHEYLIKMQAENQIPSACSTRRAAREPPEAKALLAVIRACQTEPERQAALRALKLHCQSHQRLRRPENRIVFAEANPSPNAKSSIQSRTSLSKTLPPTRTMSPRIASVIALPLPVLSLRSGDASLQITQTMSWNTLTRTRALAFEPERIFSKQLKQ